jgi:hypothetical protein
MWRERKLGCELRIGLIKCDMRQTPSVKGRTPLSRSTPRVELKVS